MPRKEELVFPFLTSVIQDRRFSTTCCFLHSLEKTRATQNVYLS